MSADVPTAVAVYVSSAPRRSAPSGRPGTRSSLPPLQGRVHQTTGEGKVSKQSEGYSGGHPSSRAEERAHTSWTGLECQIAECVGAGKTDQCLRETAQLEAHRAHCWPARQPPFHRGSPNCHHFLQPPPVSFRAIRSGLTFAPLYEQSGHCRAGSHQLKVDDVAVVGGSSSARRRRCREDAFAFRLSLVINSCIRLIDFLTRLVSPPNTNLRPKLQP